jgi:outer membrane protein assembly factor BamD (BamD/ComL family)
MTQFAVVMFVAMVAAPPMALGFQGSVSRGPIVERRDPEREKAALHNLEVARFYFQKKNWTAAERRLQEIVAEYPEFSQIPEAYFLLGEVYGKTKRRELAMELYTRVVEEFPQSEFAPKARERLEGLRETAREP